MVKPPEPRPPQPRANVATYSDRTTTGGGGGGIPSALFFFVVASNTFSPTACRFTAGVEGGRGHELPF
uniref:Uncharacterized protein n=1 Tax=Anguilla anguilla TaxID=7936 RepID=A0A0E9RWB8_ANGAN